MIVLLNDCLGVFVLCYDRIYLIKMENWYFFKVEWIKNDLCIKSYREEIKKGWK